MAKNFEMLYSEHKYINRYHISKILSTNIYM